jgi:hypothetical protein
LRASYLNIRDLLGHDKLVMPLSALDVLNGFLGDAVISLDVDEEE